MPAPARLLKAEMQAITWDAERVKDLEKPFKVQFNPETLKLSYANKNTGGDQRGGSSTQYSAKGSTKLSFDLWFDVSAPQPKDPQKGDASDVDDVRKLTEKVNELMRPREDNQNTPPGVRFLWGTFLFEGVMDSMNETLDLFSESGKPLRANVSVSLSQQEIQFEFGKQASSGLGSLPSPGTIATRQVKQGDTLQSLAASEGKGHEWQSLALANGLEASRGLPVGLRINVS